MTRQARLVPVLNLALIAGLLIVGLLAHLLEVLAAGVDYVADAAAMGVSLLAIWLSTRPSSDRRPEGYPRPTAIAAIVNAGWLLLLCIAVTIAGVDRLASGSPRVEGLPVVAAAGIAAVVMAVGALILAGDPDDGDLAGRLNVRAVLLDTIGDAAAATGVAIAGVIILATGGNYWLDPLVALVIALLVGYHAANLIQQAVAEMRSRSGPSVS